jgi:hypothetical protein
MVGVNHYFILTHKNKNVMLPHKELGKKIREGKLIFLNYSPHAENISKSSDTYVMTELLKQKYIVRLNT